MFQQFLKACPPKWIHLQGSCYWFSSNTLDWSAAKFACEALGSKLTVVNGHGEQQVLGPNVGRKIWIGLHRDAKDNKRWLWVDGSQAIFAVRSQNQSENWKGIENCVEMNTAGKWNVKNCSHHVHYACENVVGKSQGAWVPCG